MILREEEARQKWCPFTGNAEHCIGQGCMSWRWMAPDAGETLVEAVKRYRNEFGGSLLEAKTYVETHPQYRNAPPPSSGFCGLAGRPK